MEQKENYLLNEFTVILGDPKCKACLNDCKYMAVNDVSFK